MDALRSFIESSAARYIDELASFLTIPSISALPAHAVDMRRCAEWTARALEGCGLQNTRLIENDGHPVVYAEWLGAVGMPTVLCYGHYDVQPVDPVDLWDSPPFAPTVRDGRLYARGASDNKGQIFMHLKGIEAHLRTVGRLPVNVRVMVEGEEEVGGGNVAQFVRGNTELLRSDVVVVSDGAMLARGVPSICCGLRGIVYFEIAVRGPAKDLHSGSCGGAIANPALALARILAGLVDAEGRITVPGFYDNVRELAATERSALAMLPLSEERYLADLGAPTLHGEPGFSLLERLWTRPTCDVNGLRSGYIGPGTKTIIPSMATAKVSMRLVPDQDPDHIASVVEKHVRNIGPSIVNVEFRRVPGGDRPWVARHDHKFMAAAVCAIEKTFGTRPVFRREGGSNGVVTIFQDTLKAPIILLDLGLPDDNPHAPNEKMDIEQLFHGISAAAHFYDELSHVQ